MKSRNISAEDRKKAVRQLILGRGADHFRHRRALFLLTTGLAPPDMHLSSNRSSLHLPRPQPLLHTARPLSKLSCSHIFFEIAPMPDFA
jgi:hypothetical protein